MLQWIRNIGKSKFGRIFTTFLFGVLIVGFSLWGIGGIFRGAVPTAVVTVGKTEISRFALQNELENFMRVRTSQKNPISLDQIKSSGLGLLILDRLIQGALIDELARQLNIGAPAEAVRQIAMANPAFQTDGQFDPVLFSRILMANGLREDTYLALEQENLPRQQIFSIFNEDVYVPDVKTALLWRLSQEKRSIESVLIPYDETALPEIDEEALKAFFEPRRQSYTTPEQRDVSVLVLNSQTLADNISISDEDIQKEYEKNKEALLSNGKRTVEQINFGSKELAEQAAKRLAEGADFKTVAEEFNGKDGTTFIPATDPVEKELVDALDPALAQAIFELPVNKPSDVIQSDVLGSVILQVTNIIAPEQLPLEQVAQDLRKRILANRLETEIETLHSKIEDLRGEQKSIDDIGKELNLPVTVLKSIDAKGISADKQNAAQPFTDILPSFLTLVFETDKGVDTGYQQTKEGGFLWFDVTNISPQHERTFEEVRDAITEEWKRDTLNRLAKEKADQLEKRLNEGETFQSIAKDIGVEVKIISDLMRSQQSSDLPSSGVFRVFATSLNQIASIETDKGILLFKVISAEMPSFDPENIDNRLKKQEFSLQQMQDSREELISYLRKDIPIQTNSALYNQVLGGSREN